MELLILFVVAQEIVEGLEKSRVAAGLKQLQLGKLENSQAGFIQPHDTFHQHLLKHNSHQFKIFDRSENRDEPFDNDQI